MSGISSGVGLFSGIDRNAIITQLLSLDGRPKTAAQRRVVQIQAVQTALLDINTRLSALKTASTKFNLQRIFESASATSSNTDVLGASATAGATPGSYSFVVDRLVTTQQVLSRGFSDSSTTSIGASQFSFEPAAGRLDSTTTLSTLNGGTGIVRGRIQVTNSSGTATTVDLSRVETVSDVVLALNDALGARGSAAIDGDRLIVTDNAGGVGTLAITDAPGTTGTVASLGLNVAASGPGSGEAIFGSQINLAGAGTSLRTLNDGLGVFVTRVAGTAGTPDFRITTRDGSALDIDIGDIFDVSGTRTATAVSDLGGVISRINSQSGGKVTASINAAGTGLKLVDNTTGASTFSVAETVNGAITGTTAADLGILTSAGGGGDTITGRRLIASINSTLARTVRGGAGVGSGLFNVTTRDGASFSFNVSANASVTNIISEVASLSSGRLSLELAPNGRGFILRDLTAGSGPLSVDGEGALALGLSADEVSASAVTGLSAQHQFIGHGTQLSTLNAGRGVGTGEFQITDSYGVSRTITVSASATTIGDVIAAINSGQGSPNVRASINSTGDGILLSEVPEAGGAGARAISVRDTTGSVARLLGIAKEASGTGVLNKIDGSFERIVNFTSTDTLQQVANKINQAGLDVTAAIIADGSSAAPFRLALTARNSGSAGRFTIDTGGLDLGLTTLAEGNNARVFFGASDPARGILLTSTTNSFAGLANGLTVDARSASAAPVTVSVASDNAAIETAVDDFVRAYNDVANRIESLSAFDAATQRRGPLLGESSAQLLRSELVSAVLQPATGASGRFQTLVDVGLSFDRSGDLAVDREKLRRAIADDPRGVRDVFAARAQAATTPTQQVVVDGQAIPGITVSTSTAGAFTQLGVAEKLALAIDKYIKPVDGILTRRNQIFNDQIKSQNNRITAIDARLASRRANLERQFVAMESAIGRLQSQQGSLGAIAALVR